MTEETLRYLYHRLHRPQPRHEGQESLRRCAKATMLPLAQHDEQDKKDMQRGT